MPLQNWDDDALRFEQTIWRTRQIVFDCLVKPAEVIARHRRIHVMLDVKVHVPVQKAHDQI